MLDILVFFVIGLMFGAWWGWWFGVAHIAKQTGKVVGETIRILKRNGKL